MKKILLVCVLVAFYANIYPQACCCSSAGGNYSILPNLDKHVIGIRYSYSDYNTTIYPGTNMVMPNGDQMNMTGNGKAAFEPMNTLDLFGRFKLPERFNLSVFLPVHILTEKSEG